MGKQQQTKAKVKGRDWHQEYLNLENEVIQANTSLKFLYHVLYEDAEDLNENDLNGLCFLLGMVTNNIDKALNGEET